MGMTDKQFNAFVRLLLDSLKDVRNEKDPAAHEEKLDKVIGNLQQSLED